MCVRVWQRGTIGVVFLASADRGIRLTAALNAACPRTIQGFSRRRMLFVIFAQHDRLGAPACNLRIVDYSTALKGPCL
jgi:hypothetical protein